MEGEIEIMQNKTGRYCNREDTEFKSSPFCNVYQRVEVVLKKIVCSRCSENVSSTIPIYNVVSFEGRRGTGKTSAMLSVKAAMENKDSELIRD